MLRLIYYEIRKNFLQKTVLIGLALALFTNSLYLVVDYFYGMDNQKKIVTSHNVDSACYDYYLSLHKTYDGIITENKVRNSVKTYSDLYNKVEDGSYSRELQEGNATGYIYGDYYYMKTYIYEPLKYAATYTEVMKNVISRINDNISFYKKVNNQYQINNQEYLLHSYQNRTINTFYETGAWKYLFDYNFSDLLILLMLLLGIISIFTSEKLNGMDVLIQSNRLGKQNLYIGKYVAILIYTGSLSALFSLFNYIIVKGIYGLPGSSRPLYSIEEYQYTTLNGSLLSFYYLISLMKVIGFIVVAIIIGIISQRTNNIVKSFLISVIAMVGGLYISGYVQAEHMGKKLLSILSPFSLLKGNRIFLACNGVSVLGKFTLMGFVCIMFYILVLIVILFVNIWKGYQKH